MPSLKLVVLGSGGLGATGPAGSSYLVLIDGVPHILIHADPSSCARLGEAKLSPAKTDIVLLTHVHIDHAGKSITFSGYFDADGLFRGMDCTSFLDPLPVADRPVLTSRAS